MVISNLGAKPLVLQVPIGAEDQFKVGQQVALARSAALVGAAGLHHWLVLPAESADHHFSCGSDVCCWHSLPFMAMLSKPGARSYL